MPALDFFFISFFNVRLFNHHHLDGPWWTKRQTKRQRLWWWWWKRWKKKCRKIKQFVKNQKKLEFFPENLKFFFYTFQWSENKFVAWQVYISLNGKKHRCVCVWKIDFNRIFFLNSFAVTQFDDNDYQTWLWWPVSGKHQTHTHTHV